MGKILHQTTVIRDGMHNGFTDLQYWQGAYWVSYRKGAGHISMDAMAMVAVSSNRTHFNEVARVNLKGDARDPKMLVINEDRMAMYLPTWTEGAGKKEIDGQTCYKPIQQYITFSNNGVDWETPQPILDPLMWLWRVYRHDGKYYGLIQNLASPWEGDQAPHQLDLAVSDDLLSWKTIAKIGDGLNESAIHWHENGEAWVVSRSVVHNKSVFASAQAPYTDWKTVDMEQMVHSPIMLEHKGELFVAGRSKPVDEGVHDWPYNGGSLGIWRVKPGKLESVLRIPATGDCAYPGLIKDPDGRIFISYYSQHAYTLGVLPRTEIEGGDAKHSPADVYFAEIEL